MSSAYHPRRRALTLIELLVVIALILVIAALAAAFLPRLNRDTQLTNGANSIQSWLLGSKMRAKRDGLPTGVRLYVEPGASRGSVYNLQYVQQLPALSGGATVFVPTGQTPPSGYVPVGQAPNGTSYADGGKILSYDPATLTLTFGPANLVTGAPLVDFSNGGQPPSQWLVQPGDSLSIQDSGVYLIGAVLPPAQLQLANTTYSSALRIGQPTANYSILRRAQVLTAEPPLTLPPGMVIDTFLARGFGVNLPPAPAGTVYNGQPVQAYDLLFAPDGQLLNSPAGIAVIWLRDEEKIWDKSGTISLSTQLAQPGMADKQALVGISARTGMVQVQPVNGGLWTTGPNGTVVLNPFLFLQDPNSAPN